VSAKDQIQLRLGPARNSQRACVNLAGNTTSTGL
jgi:hypothetical protein